MKRFLLLTVAVPVLLTGCARHYVITFNNGHQVTVVGKPRLEGGQYVFKDAKGQPASVSAGRVREIAPASMASSRQSSGFKSEPIR